jgi:hypothetical protein
MMGRRLRDEARLVIGHGKVPANVVAALLTVTDMASDAEREFYGSIATLAGRIAKSERQARRDLHKLANLGAVARVRPGGGRGKTSVYRVDPCAVLDQPSEVIDLPQETLTPTAGFLRSKPGHGRHKTLTPVTANPDTDVRGTEGTIFNRGHDADNGATPSSCPHPNPGRVDETMICPECLVEWPVAEPSSSPRMVAES